MPTHETPRTWLDIQRPQYERLERRLPAELVRELEQVLAFIQQDGQPEATMDDLMEAVLEAWLRRRNPEDFSAPGDTDALSFQLPAEVLARVQELVEARKAAGASRARDTHLFAEAIGYFLERNDELRQAARTWESGLTEQDDSITVTPGQGPDTSSVDAPPKLEEPERAAPVSGDEAIQVTATAKQKRMNVSNSSEVGS